MSRGKVIVKNTSFLYLRMIFVLFLTLFTSRIILKNLGVTDYGLYNVVGGFVSFFTFISTSLSVSTQRFLAFELGKSNDVAYLKTFWTSVVVYAGIGLFLFIILVACSRYFVDNVLNIPEERLYACYVVIYTSIASLLFMMFQSPFSALLIANEKFNIVAYIGVLEAILKLSVASVLYYSKIDHLILYGILLAVCSATIMFVYIFSSVKLLGSVFQRKYFEFDIRKSKEILSFSFWNLWGSLSIVGCNQGINILLNMFFTPIINAARAISMQVNSAVFAFVANIHTAVIPQQTKSYAIHDKQYFEQISLVGCKSSFYLISVLIIPLFYYSDAILSLWLGIVPDYASVFVKLILINTLIDPTGGIVSGAVQATGYIRKYQFGIGVIYLLNLPISYVVLHFVENPICVFIVAITMTFVGFVYRIISLKKILKCTFLKLTLYFARVYLAVFLIFLISAFLYEFIQFSFYGFIIFCVLIVFLSCFIYYFIGTNKFEKKMLRKLLYNIVKYIKDK